MSWQTESPKNVFAYVRVSSVDQNPERQLELFSRLPESHVYVDMVSGSTRKRPRFETLMNEVLREGDTLVVKSPDRLARNTRDLLNIATELSERGVALEFVDSPELSISDAHGRLMLTIMAAFAEFERAMIRERQAEGIAIAKAKGTYAKDCALTREQVEDARRRIGEGASKSRVARDLGVSRPTLYKALNNKGAYADR